MADNDFTSEIPLKRCTKCGVEKPATPEYFYKDKKGKMGLGAKCKDCVAAHKGTKRRPDPHFGLPDGYKRCAICKEALPETVEMFAVGSSKGLSSYCRKCLNANVKIHEYTGSQENKKRCPKCNTYKPATIEHFQRDRRGKFGVSTYCKQCEKGNRKKYEYIEQPSVLKTCRLCEQDYPATVEFFVRDSNVRGGLSSRCHKCFNEYVMSIYHREDGAFKQYVRRKKRSQEYREWESNYRKKNPLKFRLKNQKRIAKKLELPNTLTEKDWQNALEYFGGCCAVCGRPPGLWHTLAMDHWIPITVPNCPGTVPTNIIPLCHGIDGCNNIKSDSSPIEFLEKKLGKRKAKKKLQEIEMYLKSRN